MNPQPHGHWPIESSPPSRGTNQVGMRQFNERTLIHAIRHHGPMPKADLARLTQLTPQTVAIIARRLLQEGLLEEQERIRGKIGQPSVPLGLRADGAFHVGIQIDRLSLNMVLVDFLGHIRHQFQLTHALPEPDIVLGNIKIGLKKMRQLAGRLWPRVKGVGICSPLDMHQWGELMGEPAARALSHWKGVDLMAHMRALTDLPLEFTKDTTAGCLAELAHGQGRAMHHFLYVFVGTFVGGGLVLDGKLQGGPRGNAGAIGSMPLQLSRSGGMQLLEQASGWQLERALIGHGLDPHLVTQADILLDQHAKLVSKWIDQASTALAMCMLSASALLDLDAVVLDGAIHPGLLARLLQATQDRLHRQKWDGIREPRLLGGQVGGHACALGAALLPLYAQFVPDHQSMLK